MKDKYNWSKLCFSECKNPFELTLFRLGLKDSVVLRTSFANFELTKLNDNTINFISSILTFSQYARLNRISDDKINAFCNFISQCLDDDLDIVEFEGIKFLNRGLSILAENFFDEGNSPFSCSLKGKKVIDIGGNIGDTALLFAKAGAQVYAFEPIPDIYDIAIKNINLNPNLKENIHFYNYAVSDKKGTLKIAYGGESASAESSSYSDKGEIIEVESITMEDILEFCPNPDLLQMDCEGAEYDIVLNSDLSMFEEVIIEYHQSFTGIDYHVLLDNLVEQGFKIDKIFKAPGANIPLDEIGIIRAIYDK